MTNPSRACLTGRELMKKLLAMENIDNPVTALHATNELPLGDVEPGDDCAEVVSVEESDEIIFLSVTSAINPAVE